MRNPGSWQEDFFYSFLGKVLSQKEETRAPSWSAWGFIPLKKLVLLLNTLEILVYYLSDRDTQEGNWGTSRKTS